MSKIKTLQQKIEEKADQRMRADLKELEEKIKNSPARNAFSNGSSKTLLVFQSMDEVTFENPNGGNNIYGFKRSDALAKFSYLEGFFGSQMLKYYEKILRPIYIELEVSRFVKEFDELKTRVDELDGDIEHYLQ